MKARAMHRPAAVILGLALVLLPAGDGRAEPEPDDSASATEIAWMHDLPAAFQQASAAKKIVMICINAKNAIGEREEPAAKGLREVVYRNPTVVKRSREFVCVLLTAEGSSKDYGELRYRFGVDGYIVSPQHIFAHPEHKSGAKPLVRTEYWTHGQDEGAVKALLALMDEAQTAYRVRERVPGAGAGNEDPDFEEEMSPESGPERVAWIAELIGLIQGDDAALRRHALITLVSQDKDGDCTLPLIPLLVEFEKSKGVDALLDVVRVLGVPGLEAAAVPLHDLLKHKEAAVRANAAVTLEYIGSATSTEPLLARAKREKVAAVANHMYRAIGRCGAGDAAAKKRLLRNALPGKKDDFESFGPVIGLAYFAGDAKVARSLETQLKKLGPPFQEGKNAHTFLRILVIWCLSEVRDPKTAPFLRKHVLKPLEEETSPWKGNLVAYVNAVARKCEGSDDVQRSIDRGIGWYLGSDNARALADEYRRERSMEKFVPKGEWGNRPAEEDEDE